MTKADLIKKISVAAGINATEAKQALDATTEAIKYTRRMKRFSSSVSALSLSTSVPHVMARTRSLARPYTSRPRR